jgi:hypothetical protein
LERKSLLYASQPIEGEASVADMIKALASKVDLKFVNVDVKSVHSNPYYEMLLSKFRKLRPIHIIADIDFGTVTIYTGKSPIDSVVPFISPENGLIGYPIFYDIGINFRCIYSPSIKLLEK